jgi:membrane associated rhomboid family serine protease
LIPLKDNIPTRNFPVVTIAIIVANVLVFIFFQQALFGPHGGFSSSGDPEIAVKYTFIPYELSHMGKLCGEDAIVEGQRVRTDGVPLCEGADQQVPTNQGETTIHVDKVLDRDQPPALLTIFTSMFMHGGILHIAFNMLFLWIFGNNVEDSMGRLRFLIFYLLAGLAAVYAQTAVDPGSTVPTIGASGAVAGVLGAYLLLLPRAKVLTMVIIIFLVTFIEIPAYVMLGIWFALQFLPAVGQVATPDIAGDGGVAYFAHVGGFVFGLLLIRLFVKERPELPGAGALTG